MNNRTHTGFTLVEMLMVIVLIGIIATLAVNKFGNLRERSALQMSIVNQKAISRAVEAFLLADGKLDRLDGLTYYGQVLSTTYGFERASTMTKTAGNIYKGPVDITTTENEGMMPSLYMPPTNARLCRYALSAQERTTLDSMIGLKYLMRHWDKTNQSPDGQLCDDGTRPIYSNYHTANGSACMISALASNNWVLAINPLSESGREVYRACGQRLVPQANVTWTFDQATNMVIQTGGPLLVFGLGNQASLIGDSRAGLESAPESAYTLKHHYTRYLLLFRLKNAGSGMSTFRTVEFAGTLDCIGNTIDAAQNTLDDM